MNMIKQLKMKNKLIDEMVFDTKNDRWIFISELKSGEFMYDNTLVTVFESQTGCRFFQTKWGNTTIQSTSWENCQKTIEDRQDNAQHYAYMEHLNDQTMLEMYNNNHNNWTGD